MTERYEISKDYSNDCITLTDNEDKLKTSFGSEIILSPLEDAETVINELNIQYSINKMLIEHLQMYEDIEDIKYWIEDIREDM